MTKPRHVERALFLMGDQNTGKSTQLRSMFVDLRLGNGGRVPKRRNLRKAHTLSRERSLYLRLTSPHENSEDIQRFLEKFDGYMSRHPGVRRWNFAGALQIDGTEHLPAGSEVIKAFVQMFSPERVRAVILSPTRLGETIGWDTIRKLTGTLRSETGCEVVTLDATDRTANGLMLADYFDFS